MKKCGQCDVEKPITDFHKNPTKKDGVQSMCKRCRSDYQKKYYKDNRDKYYQHNKDRYLRNREFVNRYKRMCKCKVCSEERWYVLDFHHIDGKTGGVSDLVRDTYSISSIKNEIRKCIVVCSNCHRELHYKEQFQQYTRSVID